MVRFNRWSISLWVVLASIWGIGACRSTAPLPGGGLDEPILAESDGDEILEPEDACPRETEDFDGFEDADGCPDPDNDGDGFADGEDLCPNAPEQVNGFEDSDGCPDADVVLCRECRATKTLLGVVAFDAGSVQLLRGQDATLEEIAGRIQRARQARGEPSRVEVVGHASDWGEADEQRALAADRAEFVRRRLVELGVERDLVITDSEGSSNPRVPHAQERARTLNDRVEILVPTALR